MTKSEETRLQNLIKRSHTELLNGTNKAWLEKLKAKKKAEGNSVVVVSEK